MSTFKYQSCLIDDVYLHSPVSPEAAMAAVANRDGLTEIFTIGTDHHVYDLAPDPESDTGWAQSDLACPGAPALIAATQDPQGRLLLAAADPATRIVWVLRETPGGPSRWGAWTSVGPGDDVVPPVTLYQLELRNTAAGATEFFLLYFQRFQDWQYGYKYRIGRALVDAATWGIGFNFGQLYSGGNPTNLPQIAIGRLGTQASLFLYWSEAQTLQAWQGLDGSTTVVPIATFAGSAYSITRLVALGAGDRSDLYATGVLQAAGTEALSQWSWTASTFASLTGPVAADDFEAVFDAANGIDILCLDGANRVYHLHGDATGSGWTPVTELADRTIGLVACSSPREGPVFVAATQDRIVNRYYREAPTFDWEVDEVDTQTTGGSKVVWYTTTMTAVNTESRAIPAADLVLTSGETTELIVNGRSLVLRANHALPLQADTAGRLTVQQSTAELGTLYVPDLSVALTDPGAAAPTVVQAYSDTRDRLYDVTGSELQQAKDRNGKPVLPDPSVAGVLAENVAASASLGRAPKVWTHVRLLRPEDVAGLTPGTVYLEPRTDQGLGPIRALDFDVDDFFQSIKDFALNVLNAAVDAIVNNGIVVQIRLAVDSIVGKFTILIDTLRQAFDAVRTLFEAVRAAFDAVLEWLGRLFDWDAIKAVQVQVKQMILGGISQIPAGIHAAGLDDVGPLFDRLRGSAHDSIEWLRAQLGADSVDGGVRGSGYTNQSALFSFDGVDLSNPANWLLDRLLPHFPGLSVDLGPFSGSKWAIFDDALTTIGNALTTAVETVATNIQDLFQPNDSESGLMAVAMGRILDQFEGLANALIDFLQTVVEALVTAVAQMGPLLQDVFTASIRIPFVADVLEFLGLGEGSFTLLDIVSILVAVPAHVVLTFVNPRSASDLAEGRAEDVKGLPFLFGGIMLSALLVLNSVNDALPEAKLYLSIPSTLIWYAFLLMTFFAGIAMDAPAELYFACVFYIFFVTINQYVQIRYAKDALKLKCLAVYAIADAVLLNVLAAIYEARNSPPPWQYVGNHVGTLPDLFRWMDFVWTPPKPRPWQARLVMVIVDLVGYGALASTAFADFADAQGRPPRLAGTAPAPA